MLPESSEQVLEGLEKLRSLGLKYNQIARFGGQNLEDVPLQEFLSGHIVGLELFADYLQEKLKESGSDQYHLINWHKVGQIARYHDLVEVEKKRDIPCPVKTSKNREEEEMSTDQAIEKTIPIESQAMVRELLIGYHVQASREDKLLKLLDKIHPHIYLMDDRYMEALLFTHSQWGIRNKPFQQERHEEIMGLLSELGIPELQDLYEVVWGRNVELGILREHPQEFMDFSTKTKEDI